MRDGKHPNRFLHSLSDNVFKRVQPHLTRLELERSDVLFNTGDTIKRVYLPHDAVLSLVIEMEAGERIEAAMFGHDGMVGATSVLDGELAVNTYIVQIAGMVSSLDGHKVRELSLDSAEFLTTLGTKKRCSLRRSSRQPATHYTRLRPG